MATPETLVKQKLNRRDEKLLKLMENIKYRRLTFGHYTTAGLPDSIREFGHVKVAVEVKANGKNPTALQLAKLRECEDHGTPAFWVAGDKGADDYYQDLYDKLSPEYEHQYIQAFQRDIAALRRALLDLL